MLNIKCIFIYIGKKLRLLFINIKILFWNLYIVLKINKKENKEYIF